MYLSRKTWASPSFNSNIHIMWLAHKRITPFRERLEHLWYKISSIILKKGLQLHFLEARRPQHMNSYTSLSLSMWSLDACRYLCPPENNTTQNYMIIHDLQSENRKRIWWSQWKKTMKCIPNPSTRRPYSYTRSIQRYARSFSSIVG